MLGLNDVRLNDDWITVLCKKEKKATELGYDLVSGVIFVATSRKEDETTFVATVFTDTLRRKTKQKAQHIKQDISHVENENVFTKEINLKSCIIINNILPYWTKKCEKTDHYN